MNVYLPSAGFATQYSRVSFGNVRYSEVEKLAQKQGNILLGGMAGIVALMIPAMGYASWALWRWNRASHASRASVMGIAKIGDITERIGRVFT